MNSQFPQSTESIAPEALFQLAKNAKTMEEKMRHLSAMETYPISDELRKRMEKVMRAKPEKQQSLPEAEPAPFAARTIRRYGSGPAAQADREIRAFQKKVRSIEGDNVAGRQAALISMLFHKTRQLDNGDRIAGVIREQIGTTLSLHKYLLLSHFLEHLLQKKKITEELLYKLRHEMDAVLKYN
jgi:hypothetical protein